MEIQKSKIDKDSSQKKDFITQINFLCNCELNKKNNKIITEYFFNKFTSSPDSFNNFILFIKEYINALDENQKQKLAHRYLNILSFLCERFWLYEEKLILDDMCFNIINPEEYKHMSALLSKYKENSKKIIKKIYQIFEDELEKNSIKAKVKWRYKNIFSIYKKCKKRNDMNALKLNDIFAFRIIVDGDSDKCFDALNILHNCFTPVPERFKDYITIPKINGYQSLHTWLLNVTPELDLIIEVQIRNIEMDEIAELWVAAHFLYWRNKKSTITNKKEEKLFHYITHSSDDSNLNKMVYCLTPDWDIITLNKWDTVIDFANKIHSHLWKKAKHAIINEKSKELDYKIKNYDIVKIIK